MFGITLHTYRMDGQVCVYQIWCYCTFFIYKMVDNSMEFQSSWFGQEFHGVVDLFKDEKMVHNTKSKVN